jgi:hypothetical protein
VLEERRMISAHIKSQEAEANKDFDTPHRLHGIEGAFVRLRNVGYQLCYANTGEPELDHDLEHCRRRDAGGQSTGGIYYQNQPQSVGFPWGLTRQS